jgi:hypothetical protein
MSVPPSGNISMLGLAREKVYDDYDYYLTPTGPYSLYDLVNGGDTHGSGVVFEDTNDESQEYPPHFTPNAFTDWYSYNHDAEEH